MPDIINDNENDRGAEAMQQIASIIRRRALARNTQALTRRKRSLFRERNDLTTRLLTLKDELRTININLIDANAEIVTIRQRLQTATQRATIERTLATREQTQGNIGYTHRSARNAYDDYRNAYPRDSDGILERYNRYIGISGLIHANSQERVRPLVDESNRVLHTLLAAEESLIDLNTRRTDLIQEIADLEARLVGLNRQSDELNRAQGKKRRHKKGTKAKRGGAWTLKYKRSINCMRPKGFSQKQYCKYGKKV